MIFKKRSVTEVDLDEFALVPLIDPVSRKKSQPQHITCAEGEDVYLVSLSNRHISFIYEMPRYFAFNYQGYFVFFFVINRLDINDETKTSIFVKSIKISSRLVREAPEIRKLIIKALFVYYGDYTINHIILDKPEETEYFTRMADGSLYYDLN